jgi:hypothetical protein
MRSRLRFSSSIWSSTPGGVPSDLPAHLQGRVALHAQLDVLLDLSQDMPVFFKQQIIPAIPRCFQ